MTHLFERITDLFIHNGIINSEDKELYTYGLQQGLIIIANILTTLFIGLLLGMVWQSIVFMLSYIPLRSFAGGYHAKTQFKCYMLSIVLTTAVLLVIKLIPWTNFMIWGLALSAGMLILIFSPLGDSNKPLDKIEISIYKRWTIIILLVEVCIVLLTVILSLYQIGACIAISLFVLSNMLIIAKLNL
ncbi:accessory gene regulator ArgB-like protein [Cellulosilyticum sp. I15G10I2]|uniref:accessory gene regulator ArgB-like protein n=1 Tax=Cellulosilyticum sp. I15G10I2 TaxID=1892843 RepID=UPI00085CA312|nr:accessory gene regulator B family protein [Cellulosilyticum sp. I15G10I2]